MLRNSILSDFRAKLVEIRAEILSTGLQNYVRIFKIKLDVKEVESDISNF